MISKKSLKFLYANSRSIVKPGKFDELACIVESFQCIIHIILLTETWLKSEDEAKRFQLPGYTHYFNIRLSSRGGGVSIFAHNSLKHSLIAESTMDENHFLWIHVSKFSLDIGVVYKPERTNNNEFLEYYSMQLENRKRALVFGDFNVDLLSSDRSTTAYRQVVKENGFSIINKINKQYSTRETNSTNTILDHVSTNLKQNLFHLAITESDMSDHKQIYLELVHCKPEPIKTVEYQAINYTNLYKTIENVTNKNPDSDYDIFEKNLTENILLNKVTKTKKNNPPRQDWINKHILSAIDKRNTLRLYCKRNPNDNQVKEELIKERKILAQDIQRTKQQFYYEAFMGCKNKPAKIWNLINKLSYNKIKDTTVPAKLQTETGEITSVQEICEHFNEYFSTIGESLANKIPTEYHHDSFASASGCQTGPSEEKLSKMTPTTKEEVVKIIDNLNLNIASGIDGINSKTIKCIKNLIAPELTKCINKCLDLGVFPCSLKIAKVTPIFKSGSKSDPSNYRPISVLPIISKVFEKILYNRLETFLDCKKILHDKQYGFRRKSNTLSATIDLTTKIKINIDKKHIAFGVFIDLKKAFDTVSHSKLLEKLNHIGVTGVAHKILVSYLENRHQVTKIGECQSNSKPITYGVPQGSILGPLLFLIYINDINEIGLRGDITLYADDTSLFYFGHSINTIVSEAQNDLNLLHKWFQYNLLTINISKTNYIIFKAKNKKITDFEPLHINSQQIKRSHCEKYLGLLLDESLSWTNHIEKIKSKLSTITGTLRGMAPCFPYKIRHLIYNSLIKPHIDYLIEIWGSAAKTNLNPVQRIQNKVIKVLFNYKYLTESKKIYKETKLLNITQSYTYFTCLLIRKIISKDIHTQINFTKRKQIQKIKLRNANDLILRKPRTNFGKKSIMFEGAQMYNKLPKDIKESQSILCFKKLLKFHILNTIV